MHSVLIIFFPDTHKSVLLGSASLFFSFLPHNPVLLGSASLFFSFWPHKPVLVGRGGAPPGGHGCPEGLASAFHHPPRALFI